MEKFIEERILIEKELTMEPHPIYDAYEAVLDGVIYMYHKGHNGYNHKGHNHNGYYRIVPKNEFGTVIVCSKNGKRCNCMHRGKFVWECFNGLVPKGFMVIHINGDANDNSLSNLKLCPKKGFKVIAIKDDARVNPRVNWGDNPEIKYDRIYESIYDASKATGVNRGLIKMICDGKVEHTKCGYSFRYA